MIFRNATAPSFLPQMLAQQVGKQPRILVAGKNSPGGHIVSAAFALIEGSVFLDQFTAVNSAVGDQRLSRLVGSDGIRS